MASIISRFLFLPPYSLTRGAGWRANSPFDCLRIGALSVLVSTISDCSRNRARSYIMSSCCKREDNLRSSTIFFWIAIALNDYCHGLRRGLTSWVDVPCCLFGLFELVVSSEGLSRFLRDSALCLSELSAGLINVDGCKGTEKFWKVNQKKRMLNFNILQNAIYQHFAELLPFL